MDRLVERINLNSNVQVQYVNTTQQVADMLTKVSFFTGSLDATDTIIWSNDTANTFLKLSWVVWTNTSRNVKDTWTMSKCR